MLTIYGIPISVHTRKTLVTANVKRLDYKVEPVVPFNPPADWPTLSPSGLIPAMQDGSTTLAESTAICFHMERKAPQPAIFPADASECSRVLFFDGYAGHVFRSVVHGLFFQKVIVPAMLSGTTDQSAVDAILATAQPQAFQFLESQISGQFLVGATLTLADIAIVSNFINYQYLGLGIDKARYPQLAKYVRGIVGLDPFQRALGNEKPFAEQMGLDRTFVT